MLNNKFRILKINFTRFACCLSSECAQEFGDNVLEFSVRCVGDLTIGRDLFKQRLFIGFDVLQEFLFEFGDLWWVHFVQVATDTAEDDSNLKTIKPTKCVVVVLKCKMG